MMRALLVLLALWMAGIGLADIGGGQSIASRYGLDTDFATSTRVELIGQQLARAAGLRDVNFTIYNANDLNAMALPSGEVYVTTQMAHEVTDAELAFVLGHELTHVKEGHSRQQAQQATAGAIVGALLAAVLGGNEQAIRMGADIAGSLTLGHYSRIDERRADEGGIKLMSRIGYDPKNAAVAMQRLFDKYGNGDADVLVIGWFADHPGTKSRKETLEKLAKEIEQHKPEKSPPPIGATLTLDTDAQHASAWAYDYTSIALLNATQARAVLVPIMQMPLTAPTPTAVPTTPVTPAIKEQVKDSRALGVDTPPADNEQGKEKNKDKGKDKEKKSKVEVLPPVTVVTPPVSVAYQLTLALRQTAAGRAAEIAKGDGSAVEAVLRWHNIATGMSGVETAIAQTTTHGPWMANEQLKDPAALHRLSNGKEDNIEGTLEAAAVRRVVRAFAEVVEAGGPVDHSVPVTIRLTKAEGRLGDYIAVIRDKHLVAEVAIDKLTGRTVTGTVLWGVHSWKKNDLFVMMK